jgi:PDZ domain-containing secreted protein
MTIKKIKISDIRKTFSCNRKQAENIREMIKSLSIEAFDEAIDFLEKIFEEV